MAGWPLQMGEVQAQVGVGDVNSDGYLELVAADARGNVAAFSWKAEELWERHVASLVSQVCLSVRHSFSCLLTLSLTHTHICARSLTHSLQSLTHSSLCHLFLQTVRQIWLRLSRCQRSQQYVLLSGGI